MLATIAGDFAVLLGLLVLLLPLFLTELSRPRDALVGAVFLLLGLVLITSHDRLLGSPMLAVLGGTFLISRLGLEVVQSRWAALSSQEKVRIGSIERWTTSFDQLKKAFLNLGEIAGEFLKLFRSKPKPSSIGKKWVRPDVQKEQSTSEDSRGALKEVMSASAPVDQETKETRYEQKPSSEDF